MKKKHNRNQEQSEAGTNIPQTEEDGLLLNEDLLITLAMRELKGSPPPGYEDLSFSFSSRKKDHQHRPISLGKSKGKIARELESRGWTVHDFAKATGLDPAEASALVKGNIRINSDLAQKLGHVFATSTDFWLQR